MLRGLTVARDRRVLVGVAEGDDAGIVSLGRGLDALVHTVDLITPIVDDPWTFGRVAAANSVSDVFAMGGRPTSAVAILAVPKELPPVAVERMLAGAHDLLAGCGAFLVGGHTVKDKELKLGFAVTGLVKKRNIATVARAKPGRVLVLTKALGTGVLWQAMKAEKRTADEERAVIDSMTATNAAAARIMIDARVRCATDVTGFGLVGHALNIARHSGVDLEIDAPHIPALPGVLGYLDMGIAPGTIDVNLRGYGDGLVVEEGVAPRFSRLAADPQTSGGLLMVVPLKKAEAIRRATGGWIIGRTTPVQGDAPKVRLLA